MHGKYNYQFTCAYRDLMLGMEDKTTIMSEQRQRRSTARIPNKKFG